MGKDKGLDPQPEMEDFEVYLYLWGEEISPGAVLAGPSSIDVEVLEGMPIYRRSSGASAGDPKEMIGVIQEVLKDEKGLLARGRVLKGALKDSGLMMGGTATMYSYGAGNVIKDVSVSGIQLRPKDLGDDLDV